MISQKELDLLHDTLKELAAKIKDTSGCSVVLSYAIGIDSENAKALDAGDKAQFLSGVIFRGLSPQELALANMFMTSGIASLVSEMNLPPDSQ